MTPGPGLPVWAAVAVMACGIATVFAAARTRARTAAALALLVVLAGYFGIFVGLAPGAAGGQVLPTVLFFGSLAIFRLMSRFESR